MTKRIKKSDQELCSNCGQVPGVWEQSDPELAYCDDCDVYANNPAEQRLGRGAE